MTITTRAVGMELTPAIKEYAESKISGLDKFYDNIIHIEIDLGLDTKHHNKGDIYKCAASVQVPNKVFMVEKEEKDLYKAVDKVKDHLREEIIAWKEKNRDKHRNSTD